MGTVCACPCIPCRPLKVDEIVRYMLCPAWERAELEAVVDRLRRSRRAVEEQIPLLAGAVRVDVRLWVDAVVKHEEDVSNLFEKLNRRPPCFRSICCLLYPQNFKLSKKMKDTIKQGKSLQNEYDVWGGNLVVTAAPALGDEETMDKEWETLVALREDLESMVEEQIGNSGYRKTAPCRLLEVWMDRVRKLAAEVDQIKAMVDDRRPNTIAKMIADIRGLIKQEKELRSRGELVQMADPDRIPDLADSHPGFLVRVEDHISKILGYLKDDRVNVIGIHGMGGVGKTTLVKETVRRLRWPEPEVDFDLVIFVVVSQVPNIFNIQKEIGISLGTRGSYLPSDERERANILKGLLSGRRFLLILDDVWKNVDLEKIGVPPLSNDCKSKVLLTTRELKVCEFMKCKEMLLVGTLGIEDSQNLFYHICEKDENHLKMEKEIGKIAQRIVRKCGGLPLVIVTVARALTTKSSVQDWRDAEHLLCCSPCGHIREMKDVFQLLKFSFDYLERDEYRSCLLFCALFPEDSNIHIDEVIRYWIGEGLLDFTGISNLSGLEAFGRQNIIPALRGACLLEKGKDENHVKMHDSIRDMTIWLGKCDQDSNYKHKFLSAESGENMVKQCIVDSEWKELDRVCFFRGIQKVVISGEISASAFLSLRTAIFRGEYTRSLVDIPEEFFSFTPNLRVLDLSQNIHLHSLPGSLWSLKSLRYLDLSRTGLKRIAKEIGSLISLQFLNLKYSDIEQVPVEVGQLTNLVVLDLSCNRMLSSIPYLAISSLLKLQILELANTGSSSSDGGRIKDLNNLVRLSNLSLTLHTLEDVKEMHEHDVLNRSISFLRLCSVEKLTVADVSLVLSKLSMIKILHIMHCEKLEGTLQLPRHSLQKLEQLVLSDLPLLSCLAVESQWQLPNLRSLRVHHCFQLRDLGCLLQLPNLKYLQLRNCEGMEELIPSSEEAAVATGASSSGVQCINQISPLSFPKLMEIDLSVLPSLESISKMRIHLPSLDLMKLRYCSKLRKLAVIESEKTVTIRCKKQWWEQLQWEDGGRTAQDRFLFGELQDFGF